MCIVPRLVDWCIAWYACFKLFVFSHFYELWRCSMHLCFATLWGTSWIPLCYVFYMWNKQTYFNQLLFMIFVCSLSCCMHSYYVLLLELHLSCTCLEFFDPSFQCLQMVGSLLWGCMSPQKLFCLSLTYSRMSRS